MKKDLFWLRQNTFKWNGDWQRTHRPARLYVPVNPHSQLRE
jgi:hypothetical protein